MADDIPQWAEKRARELADAETSIGCVGDTPNLLAFSAFKLAFTRYIAQHEQEPVDPAIAEAIELVAALNERQGYHSTAAMIRNGTSASPRDKADVDLAAFALKRGMELALSPAASDVEQPSASSSTAFEARGRQGGSS